MRPPDTLDVPSPPALLCEIYGVRHRKLSDAIPNSTTQNAKSTAASIAILTSGNAYSSAAPPKDCMVVIGLSTVLLGALTSRYILQSRPHAELSPHEFRMCVERLLRGALT